MKTYFLPLTMGFLMILCGCTEYVELEKIVIQRDTVKVKEYVDRVFLRVDTVSVPVNVPVPTLVQGEPTVIYRDSIIYVDRVDSVFVERIVHVTNTIVEHDTVVVREITYGEVLVVYGGRTTYQVQAELQPMVTDFFIQAQARGYAPAGGLMTVMVENIDKVLQAYSHHAMGLTIVVNGNLTIDQMYIPVMRELARQQLGKEYSKDPSSPMYPFFAGVQDVRYSNRDKHKAVIDKIFQ
jgi:hypothetical protein